MMPSSTTTVSNNSIRPSTASTKDSFVQTTNDTSSSERSGRRARFAIANAAKKRFVPNNTLRPSTLSSAVSNLTQLIVDSDNVVYKSLLNFMDLPENVLSCLTSAVMCKDKKIAVACSNVLLCMWSTPMPLNSWSQKLQGKLFAYISTVPSLKDIEFKLLTLEIATRAVKSMPHSENCQLCASISTFSQTHIDFEDDYFGSFLDFSLLSLQNGHCFTVLSVDNNVARPLSGLMTALRKDELTMLQYRKTVLVAHMSLKFNGKGAKIQELVSCVLPPVFSRLHLLMDQAPYTKECVNLVAESLLLIHKLSAQLSSKTLWIKALKELNTQIGELEHSPYFWLDMLYLPLMGKILSCKGSFGALAGIICKLSQILSDLVAQ